MDSKLGFGLVFIDWSGRLVLLASYASVLLLLIIILESIGKSSRETSGSTSVGCGYLAERRTREERTLGLAEACDRSRRMTSFVGREE